MDAILTTQVELPQRGSHPHRIERQLEIGDMDIAIEQTTLVEGTLLAMHLSLDVARTEVLHKQTLEGDATTLHGTREDDQSQGYHSDGDDERIGEVAELMTDIEDEGEGNDHAHDHREDEGQAVAIALCPQGLPLFAAILLHDHRTQER